MEHHKKKEGWMIGHILRHGSISGLLLKDQPKNTELEVARGGPRRYGQYYRKVKDQPRLTIMSKQSHDFSEESDYVFTTNISLYSVFCLYYCTTPS